MNLSRTFGKVAFKLNQHSPEICVAGGIACFVGAIIFAAKSSKKLEETMDVAAHRISDIKEVRNGFNEDEYSMVTYRKDLAMGYLENVKDYGKVLAPVVSFTVLGCGLVLYGHHILRKRNLALIAAYSTLEETFRAYRSRVIEDVGEEKDKYYRTGIRQETVEAIEVNDKGKEVKKKEDLLIFDGKEYSQYARFFDESCKEWSKSPEYNLSYLIAQQRSLNHTLQARGHVFLNEVYDALGIPRTQAGAVVGWVYGNGDNYIDFGIYEGFVQNRNFVNGYERVILLDFNVDGVIYDKI